MSIIPYCGAKDWAIEPILELLKPRDHLLSPFFGTGAVEREALSRFGSAAIDYCVERCDEPWQKQLVRDCAIAAARGARVVISNSLAAEDLIREMAHRFLVHCEVRVLEARSTVGQKASSRGKAPEILALLTEGGV